MNKADRTHIRIFAENSAVRAAAGSGADDYSVIESSRGYVTSSINLGSLSGVSVYHFPPADEMDATFSCVEFGPVKLHVESEALDAAVELRDALNKAIRFCRRRKESSR